MCALWAPTCEDLVNFRDLRTSFTIELPFLDMVVLVLTIAMLSLLNKS